NACATSDELRLAAPPSSSMLATAAASPGRFDGSSALPAATVTRTCAIGSSCCGRLTRLNVVEVAQLDGTGAVHDGAGGSSGALVRSGLAIAPGLSAASAGSDHDGSDASNRNVARARLTWPPPDRRRR